MKTKIILALCCVSFLTIGCTKNSRTRNLGGKEEVSLKPNEKLMNVTWKENSMWMLTEDTVTHIQYFRESSSWGVWEGEITIK